MIYMNQQQLLCMVVRSERELLQNPTNCVNVDYPCQIQMGSVAHVCPQKVKHG